MFCKVQFFFEFTGEGGWSEVYYKQFTDFTQAVDTTIAGLATARNKCLASKTWVRMTYIRWSDEAVRGDALLRRATGIGHNIKMDDILPAPVFTAALLRLESSALYRRHLWMRGIPSTVTNPPFDPNIDPVFKASVQAFINKLISENWLLRHIASVAQGNPIHDVIGVDAVVGSDRTFTLHLNNNTGISIGDTVAVYNMREMPWLQGRHKVMATPTNAVTLYLNAAHTVVPLVSASTLRRVTPAFDPITNGEWLDVSHRDTGRPFGLRAGRRPVRKQ